MELTRDQKDLLDVIMNDKYANGAFCGMIFNSLAQRSMSPKEAELAIDMMIQYALMIRLRAMELSK